MPGRHRIDDRAPAERRLSTEDHAVAARRHHRGGEAELGEAFPETHDPCRAVRRAEVHLHTRIVRDRKDLLEDDVEAVRRRVRAGRDQRLSPRDVTPLDPGKAHRNALTGFRPIDVAVMHLDAADPHVATRRLEPKLVSRTDRARPERAGHDRAEAGD